MVANEAILGGDFTPLHVAQMSSFPGAADGREVQVQTDSSADSTHWFLCGLRSSGTQCATRGRCTGYHQRKDQDQANAQIDRIKSIPDLVRGTNKKECYPIT